MDVPRDILTRYRTITVVGCSTTPGKDAHDVPRVMQENGFEIVPVNPTADEILGVQAYPSLADAPTAKFVNVFRPSEEAPAIVRDAVDAGAEVVWLQLGITSPEARRIAEDAGLQYVEDKCVKVEWRRVSSNQ